MLNGPPPGCGTSVPSSAGTRSISASPATTIRPRGNGTVPQRERGSARRAAARAGRPLDVDALLAAYYDASAAPAPVAFGTSGPPRHVAQGHVHRSPRPGHQRGDLPLPRRAGDRRAAVRRPRHARAVGARVPHDRRGARRRTASTSSSTPTTATRRRPRSPTRSSPTTAARRTRRPTGSSSRRRTTRPRTAASSTTRRTAARRTPTSPGWIEGEANELLERRARRRPARGGAGAGRRRTTTSSRLRRRPPARDRPRRDPRRRRAPRRRPARRRERRLLPGDRASATGSTSRSSTRRSTRPSASSRSTTTARSGWTARRRT